MSSPVGSVFPSIGDCCFGEKMALLTLTEATEQLLTGGKSTKNKENVNYGSLALGN